MAPAQLNSNMLRIHGLGYVGPYLTPLSGAQDNTLPSREMQNTSPSNHQEQLELGNPELGSSANAVPVAAHKDSTIGDANISTSQSQSSELHNGLEQPHTSDVGNPLEQLGEVLELIKTCGTNVSTYKYLCGPNPSPKTIAALASQLGLVESEDNTLGNEPSDMIVFLAVYPRLFLARLVLRGIGFLPSTFGTTWAALLHRGRRRSDTVEVQEFFFGIEPLQRFSWQSDFEKLPIELRIIVLKTVVEQRTIEVHFSRNEDPSNPSHTQFLLHCRDFPTFTHYTHQTRHDLLESKYAPYKQIFDHEKCQNQVYFNRDVDFLHVPRSWDCIQVFNTIKQLSFNWTDSIKKLSIFIDWMESTNIWVESVNSEVPGQKLAPLLSFFRGLEHVEFLHRVENETGGNGWYNVHPGTTTNDCTYEPGSRFCYPLADTVKLRDACTNGHWRGLEDPIQHTLGGVARYGRWYMAEEKKRLMEANQLAQARQSEHAKKLLEDKHLEELKELDKHAVIKPEGDSNTSGSMEVENLEIDIVERKVPDFTCRFAHKTQRQRHQFCPWVGPAYWEAGDINHCCGFEHLADLDDSVFYQ
ncbi:uncharacterized protein PAC_11509 [Phialocephala subalpina]|uniref:2EXR domain-containing protein n=1 Tax=Phialocephala subalpina TaxID=576137 RepID=A0A1L7X9C3_9HELO|nr:uncharacterized protein PAC_11509 [Phialocephala subalpina]